jgi:peroxiredoxin
MWILVAAFLGLEVVLHFPASAEGGASTVASHPMIGQSAPAFDLQEVSDGSLSLEGLRGRYVVLHFGASWWPFCNAEAPHLQELGEACEKRGVTALVINVKE